MPGMTRIIVLLCMIFVASGTSLAQEGTQDTTPPAAQETPADGHDIHVLAPHVVNGKVMGPYHHFCKVLSEEPVIECLIYESTDPKARLVQIEYIIAKTLTRETIPLKSWNRNWHDHEQEISTDRVQVLDLPPDKAKEVSDLVSTTDGIIFHLWPEGEKLPTGKVSIAQSVGHRDLKADEYKKYRK